jgi:hypothetical protein
MQGFYRRLPNAAILILAVMWLAMAPARAATVHGTVRNGTTGKAAAGVTVQLIQLQGGMQPVANVQSGSQGEFSFDNPTIGVQPMLVRAIYHGVNFHQPLPPRGVDKVEVTVFEQTKDPKAVAVTTRIVFFQPSGNTLLVGEEYSLENSSQPPQAFYRGEGNFEFSVPEGAKLQQVAAAGPAGMPVVQATIDKSKNRYAIAYAFRPGESTVRYSYELPYTNNAATVKIPPSPWIANRVLVVAAPTIEVKADGLQSAGQEQGMNVYQISNLAPNATVAVNLSGTAPPLSAGNRSDQEQQGSGGGGPAEAAGAASAAANIQAVPGRLDALKWPLLAGFLGVFAVCAILLARKPVTVAGSPSGSEFSSTDATDSPREVVAASAATGSVASSAEQSSASTAFENVNAAVNSSLEYLKEQLFRLELRHQAGTISDEEYATERARAEKVLRDLVRG